MMFIKKNIYTYIISLNENYVVHVVMQSSNDIRLFF